MPHEQLLELLANLKLLLEKERDIRVKDGWTNLLKQKAESNVDNAITQIQGLLPE